MFSPLLARSLAGVALAGVVIVIARHQRTLSRSGAGAALVAGVACTAAGWGWAVLLVTMFATATLLSRYQRSIKSAKVEGMVEKGMERDVWQVAANGGVFVMAAIASLIYPAAVWSLAGAGAIAASTADTWATEIGTLAPHPPKLITTGEIVPAGTSGAVTWAGSLAGLAGAACIAAVALLAGWGVAGAAAAMAGGIAGSLVDSLVGATIQSRRWCERCGQATERAVHRCGTTTRPDGGIRWVNNDVVNAISSLTGAAVGVIWL